MYYSAIGVLAVIVLLIVNHDILLSRGDAFRAPAWKVYRRFLVAVLVYYITDILWGILYEQHLIPLVFADTAVYFIAMTASVLLWPDGKTTVHRKILTIERNIWNILTKDMAK